MHYVCTLCFKLSLTHSREPERKVHFGFGNIHYICAFLICPDYRVYGLTEQPLIASHESNLQY